MNYKIIKPSNYISNIVKYFWIMESTIRDYCEKIIPTGEPQILFHFKDPFYETAGMYGNKLQPASVLCGQVLTPKNIYTSKVTSVIGAVFHPFGLHILTGIPSYEFNDYSIDMNDINLDFRFLIDNLQEKKDDADRIGIIEKYFIDRIKKNSEMNFPFVKYITKMINESKGIVSVDLIAEKSGFSERHFRRIFKEYTGLSPKKYIEIIKFNNAINLFNDEKLDLTDISYKSGYYDQAQFIHSFKNHSGLTPGDFRKKYTDCHR